jgi:hypothetical protein
LHDKIEFEVALTSMTFDFNERTERLRGDGFSLPDLASLRDALSAVTRSIMAHVAAALQQIRELEAGFVRVTAQTPPSFGRALQLLRDCRGLGTPAFARLARAAFVAVGFLRSAVERRLISAEERESFQRSISSGVRHIKRDAFLVRQGKLPWSQFVETYGHLRPGTYDLTVPSYGDAPNTYLRPMVAAPMTKGSSSRALISPSSRAALFHRRCGSPTCRTMLML